LGGSKTIEIQFNTFFGIVKVRVVAGGSIPAGTEFLGPRVQRGELHRFSVTESKRTWLFVSFPVKPLLLLFHRGVFV